MGETSRLRAMSRWRTVVLLGIVAVTVAIASLGGDGLLRSLWPAAVAFVGILLLREAAVGLACGVAAAALLVAGGNPLEAVRLAMVDHVFPAMQGPWRIGALVFTLLIGAFAGVLEASGAFEGVMRRMMKRGKESSKHLLTAVFGVGLLCFFDGLASSLLAGRVARPLVDRAGISRERLAWVVDSTGSPVACVAFVSTWIATQLSLIEQGLVGAAFPAEPYAMFFRSVVANPYCLLTLWLVFVAIRFEYQPRVMRKFAPEQTEATGETSASRDAPVWVVVVPLMVLVGSILAGFVWFAGEPVNPLTLDGWRRAFGGSGGPYALVFGSLLAWLVALAVFPASWRSEAVRASAHGASALLPALMVLIAAWSLGSLFEALGTTKHVSELLGSGVGAKWMPLLVFFTGSAMAFTTGSSWATMGLLMPLALPATLAASADLPMAEAQAIAAMVIGAVFGGATLGDHCSPFSDTTIVSAVASGCRTMDHVISQLPFAGMAAGVSALAYVGMALGVAPWLALLAGAGLVPGLVCSLRHVQNREKSGI